MSETASGPHPLLVAIQETLGASVVGTGDHRGDLTIHVAPEAIVDVCTVLRDEKRFAFDFLMDLTAVDYLGSIPRFEVVYHLYSTSRNHRLRVKARVPEATPRIATVVGVWKAADWLERETWDMYGITFDGHPDLRRIYLYEEFQGHPLRKDYPKEKRQPLVRTRDVHAEQARRLEAREGIPYGKWH